MKIAGQHVDEPEHTLQVRELQQGRERPDADRVIVPVALPRGETLTDLDPQAGEITRVGDDGRRDGLTHRGWDVATRRRRAPRHFASGHDGQPRGLGAYVSVPPVEHVVDTLPPDLYSPLTTGVPWRSGNPSAT